MSKKHDDFLDAAIANDGNYTSQDLRRLLIGEFGMGHGEAKAILAKYKPLQQDAGEQEAETTQEASPEATSEEKAGAPVYSHSPDAPLSEEES